MFKIDGKQNIYISRGDTARCSVGMTSPIAPYEEYEMQEGDTLTFTVSATPTVLGEPFEPLIQKTLTTNEIDFEIQDTANLEFGQYFYDIKINFADGRVNTIIPYVTGKYFNLVADLPSFYVCEVVH